MPVHPRRIVQGNDASRSVSVAYGRQSLPTLLRVLSEAGRSAEDTLNCLQALEAAVVSQEQKAEAIRLGASPLVITCIVAGSRKVSESGCRVLNKLIALMEGRQEAVKHGAVEALTHVLPRNPVVASRCLKDLSKTLPGAEAMLQSGAGVVVAVTQTIEVRELSVACMSSFLK